MGNSRFKFRVWSNKYNDYLSPEIITTIMGLCKSNDLTTVRIGALPSFDGNLTIEQCTGLKDKNGSLIYEGDILQTPNKDQYIVEWIVDGYWHIRQIDDEKFGCALASIKTLYDGWEIIGNIHEQKDVK